MQAREQPLVTIAIPTFNRANGGLQRALGCAAAQTYPRLEIVVCDNCSSDTTPEVVARFREGDERIRYIRHAANLGANGNFNACLDEARGDYFLLLHDDDAIDPDFVEVCLAAADHSTHYGFIRTGTRVIDGAGKLLRELPNGTATERPAELFLAWMGGKTAVYLCTTLFNTQALREAGGFRSLHNLFEDGRAIVRIAAAWPWVDVREPKGSFRVHPAQRTAAAHIGQWCEEFRALIELMCEQAPERCAEIRERGMHFFARLALNRTRTLKPGLPRYLGRLIVLRYFAYRYWPRGGRRRFLPIG